MKIAVLGDLHHVRPEGYGERRRQGLASKYEIADMESYLRLQSEVVPAVCREIAASRPDFCICTGDAIQGFGDTARDNCEEMREALRIREALGASVLYTLGTHDGMERGGHGPSVREVWVPSMQSALAEVAERFGMEIASPQEGSHTLRWGDTALLLLDYTSCHAGDAQERAARRTLSDPSLAHVLLFAHAPLEPVFRFGFSRAEYVRSILPLVRAFPVDALFCAHTHNQVASLHATPTGRYAQLQSTPLALPAREPADLRESLPRLCDCEIGWSYWEGTMPSWWLLNLTDGECRADWYALGRGRLGSVRLERGESSFALQPQTAARAPAWRGESPLWATLSYSGSGVNADVRWSLNGVPLAPPAESSYFLRQSISVPVEALGPVHRLRVCLPERDCCLGGFVLTVGTESGAARSKPSGYLTNTGAFDEWGYDRAILARCPRGEARELELIWD